MKKGQMGVVLAIFLFLFFSQGVMGQGPAPEGFNQGLDEAKRLEQKVIELYKQERYEEAINYVKRSLEIIKISFKMV